LWPDVSHWMPVEGAQKVPHPFRPTQAGGRTKSGSTSPRLQLPSRKSALEQPDSAQTSVRAGIGARLQGMPEGHIKPRVIALRTACVRSRLSSFTNKSVM
jgi:hypothetical protein